MIKKFSKNLVWLVFLLIINSCGYKVDIWALGCTFFELLTGSNLFNPKKDKYDTTHQHLNDIINVIGKIPKKLIKKSKVKKKYFKKDYKLKDFKKENNQLDNILDYNDIVDVNIRDFIKKCLTLRISERPSAKDLLNHQLFTKN